MSNININEVLHRTAVDRCARVDQVAELIAATIAMKQEMMDQLQTKLPTGLSDTEQQVNIIMVEFLRIDIKQLRNIYNDIQ